MWTWLAATTDFVHALLMSAWVLGLPLLFWRRRPRLTRAYGIYAIAFIVVSQVSHAVLGECVFTAVARWCAEHASSSSTPVSEEWFTVRAAQAIFHLTPSHRGVTWVSEALIFVTALGALSWANSGSLSRRRTPVRSRPSTACADHAGKQRPQGLSR
jgi:hypothetical protein